MNEAFFREAINPVSASEIPEEFIEEFQSALRKALLEDGTLNQEDYYECLRRLQFTRLGIPLPSKGNGRWQHFKELKLSEEKKEISTLLLKEINDLTKVLEKAIKKAQMARNELEKTKKVLSQYVENNSSGVTGATAEWYELQKQILSNQQVNYFY